jgi:hypothetical protein
MPSESFIKQGTVDRITRLVRRGYETKRVMAGGGTWVEFSRYSQAAQKRIAMAPQLVLVEFANTQMDRRAGESAISESTDGTLTKVIPFDVEKGDMFLIGEEGSQEVATISIVFPPQRGIQKAGFTLTLGEKR